MNSFYSIYDKKALSYSNPFLARNHDCAKRMVQSSMDFGSMLRRYPDDFCLVKLAEYDTLNGQIKQLSKEEFVCELSNLLPLPFDDFDGKGDGEADEFSDRHG